MYKRQVEIISDKKKLAALTPNDLFQYKNGQINIEQTDITQYISWVEGWYIFESEQLPSILDRLSRYYGKEIKYHKKENLSASVRHLNSHLGEANSGQKAQKRASPMANFSCLTQS